jgi:tyrosinase
MKPFRSQPLDLPADRERVVRADLIFYGVDHSGPSYEGRVFLGEGRVSDKTPREAAKGYAGSFMVFGHGGCFGSDSHCAPQDRYSDEFDRRPPHPLTPQIVSLSITDALSSVEASQVKVTVVPVVRELKTAAAVSSDVAPCESVRIVTYAA